MDATTEIVIDGPVFYSQGDESAFFRWLEGIPAVVSVGGSGRQMHIQLTSQDLDENSLRELIAILYRYKMAMSDLKRFVTDDNREWFHDNRASFWHPHVFGGASSCEAEDR